MEMWTGPEFTKRHRGRMGIMGSIATWLGVAFAIVGIIAEASGKFVIGLYLTSWFHSRRLSYLVLLRAGMCACPWALVLPTPSHPKLPSHKNLRFG